VAEVGVTARAIRVVRLWCCHDCGAIVDPSGVRAQVEGNLVWSIGMVLGDELTTPGGAPAETGFTAYALPRIDAIPEMHIDLVESAGAASGAGETAIVAGPGAILNAIAAATGVRPTRLPVRAAAAPGR
jgi:isoquinoline 1-oxidoreductase beta subunit